MFRCFCTIFRELWCCVCWRYEMLQLLKLHTTVGRCVTQSVLLIEHVGGCCMCSSKVCNELIWSAVISVILLVTFWQLYVLQMAHLGREMVQANFSYVNIVSCAGRFLSIIIIIIIIITTIIWIQLKTVISPPSTNRFILTVWTQCRYGKLGGQFWCKSLITFSHLDTSPTGFPLLSSSAWDFTNFRFVTASFQF
jgi:hypothetical protein